jgi:organic radical activating enzyme
MIIPHDKFCVLPWVSLEASPVGTVRPCCLADDEILDDKDEKCRLGHMPFEDIRDTQHMRHLREQFLNGEQPKTCRRCWAEEDAGRTSKRMHTLDRLKHMLDDSAWTTAAKPLMFLDLKLGNICNLKCRICGSWSSSVYAAEEIKFQTDKKNNFHYVMMKLGRWPRETPRFWQELKHNAGKLQYLEFTGGEPFLIEEHFDLLRRLVVTGHAANIEIHYNTNGTIFPVGAEEIWSHFKHVEIAFSIDDVGDRFEYQRTNAEWLPVNSNIQLFREMRERHSNISLQACCTINVFNVLYLDQVAAWIDTQDFDYVYWNMLHDAPHFCIATLPQHTKLAVENKLRTAEFSQKHQAEIDRVIDFMMQGTSQDVDVLHQSIRSVDVRRRQDIVSVAPEFAAAIDYAT